MSLSNPIERSSTNPITRYYTWNGAKGNLSYYDKETGNKEDVTGTFVFIPTDQKNMVEGFNSKKNMGFRSNEVNSTVKEELIVKWNGGQVLLKGLYNDIKAQIKEQGGKYTKSIYGVTKIDGVWELINLKFKGAAFSSWLEFDQKATGGVEGLTIAVKSGVEKTTGMVKYFEPVFRAKPSTEADHKAAVEKDVELQDYILNRDTPLSQTSIEELTADEKAQLRAPGSTKQVVETTKTIIAIAEFEDEDADDFFGDL